MKREQLPLYAIALAVLIVGLAYAGVPLGTLIVLREVDPEVGKHDARGAVAGMNMIHGKLLVEPAAETAAMALSSLSVVSNANRLRRFRAPSLPTTPSRADVVPAQVEVRVRN